ncbi:polysaccharide deacetylase family protein [Saliphagus sp. LR7]|uniref:polysaccharide deacetylase family protein n=1 Tax=Saliphagus sp. LR7 TaxID=2282654 RepID=UPI000DF7F438|nr:polysaccharide deacetylase family protein [Saliphagus sp. LR7]
MDERPPVTDAAWSALAAIDRRVGVSRLVPTTGNAVLMYHSVGSGTGNARGRTLPTAEFCEGIRRLAAEYEFVDLPAVLEESDERRLAVTFDDGFRSVATEAAPVLSEFSVPATCFLIADRIGGETERGVPYMTESEIEDLVGTGLVTIGNHTRSHPWLGEIEDEERLREEILGAKEALESCFDCEIDRFCYPYGDASPKAAELVAAGHSYATVGDGLVGPRTDPLSIPRIDGSHPRSRLEWELTGVADRLREGWRRLR